MNKPTNTTNEKALGRQSEGSMKCTTNESDSTGTSPAQTELTFDCQPEQSVNKKESTV